MNTCKNCGRPLIIKGGKCLYCGAEPTDGWVRLPETARFRIKKVIDIVCCVDCSWPMAPILDSVKESIVNLFERINGFNEDSEKILADWRARIIGYRSFLDDNEHLLNDHPFVSTMEEVQEQLSGIVCKGCSENRPYSSSLDALWYAAKTSDWRPVETDSVGRRAKNYFVLLFTANPTLPVHRRTIDEIAGADRDIDTLLEVLAKKRITLSLFVPDDPALLAFRVVPYSEIEVFNDPIEYYYHKQLDFSSIIESFVGPKT